MIKNILTQYNCYDIFRKNNCIQAHVLRAVTMYSVTVVSVAIVIYFRTNVCNVLTINRVRETSKIYHTILLPANSTQYDICWYYAMIASLFFRDGNYLFIKHVTTAQCIFHVTFSFCLPLTYRRGPSKRIEFILTIILNKHKKQKQTVCNKKLMRKI